MGGYEGEGVIGVELFDILKSRAGIPAEGLAQLFAGNSNHEPGEVTVYCTTDNKIYADANGAVYVLKEE